jgi:uncharacterized protein YndB with AHSA1/START domain
MGTLPRSGSVTVTSAATPDQVWRLLADVTRVGDWSHETHGSEWVDGATEAVVGARFRGRNRRGRTRWSRLCEVTAVEPGRQFEFRTVPSRVYNDSTSWRFDLEPTDGGCRITQSFEVLKLSALADRLFYLLIPAHRDRSEALRGDLERLSEVAARTAAEPAR